MKDRITTGIKQFLAENKANWFEDVNDRWFDEPIVQFADADDAIFTEYKSIIGEYHMTPAEVFNLTFGEGSFQEGTVISIVLPINEVIRKTNRPQQEWASREMALLRTYQVEIINEVSKYVESVLRANGYRAITPYQSEWFKRVNEPTGPSSNWSERHIAYAAGLGTFSLNDGFITEKGIAVKLISVVTDLKVPPDARKEQNHTANCLYCSQGICGACIKRCPVQAITKDGHDKIKCFEFVYGEKSKDLAESYGGNREVGSGCGLCQSSVPCEYRNPVNNH